MKTSSNPLLIKEPEKDLATSGIKDTLSKTRQMFQEMEYKLCSYVLILCISVLATTNSCPTWQYYNNDTGQCKCYSGLECSSEGNIVQILNGMCATVSESKGEYFSGSCPFWHPINSTNRLYSLVPSNVTDLNAVMCGPYNRKGILCGECIDGYGPAVYSMDLKCANCSGTWPGYVVAILYLLLQFVPTTLLFVVLFVFQLNITSGPLLGYVIFCQLISFACSGRQIYIYNYMMSNMPCTLKFFLYFSYIAAQFWSLQFFKGIIPPFCINDKLTQIDIEMFHFIPVIYPVVLVIITCVLMKLHAHNYRVVVAIWRPFNTILKKANIREVTGDAIFHTFASFLFLSNSMVLITTAKLLDHDLVINASGHIEYNFLYFDPSVKSDGLKQTWYSFATLVVFICFTLIPSLLLCLYPTRLYRYFSKYLSGRKQLAITAFVEALNSCYKDGLNGTRDYRSLAGSPVLVCIPYSVGYSFLHIDHQSIDFIKFVSLLSLILTVLFIKPCKKTIANASLNFHVILIFLLIYLYHLWLIRDPMYSTNTLYLSIVVCMLLPRIIVILWICYKLIQYTRKRLGHRIDSNCITKSANGVKLCFKRKRRNDDELLIP